MSLSQSKLKYRLNDENYTISLYTDISDLRNKNEYLSIKSEGMVLYANIGSEKEKSHLRTMINNDIKIVNFNSGVTIPVSLWEFKEESGNFVFDSIEPQTNGELINNPIRENVGPIQTIQKSISFDGTNKYIDFGDNFNFTNEISISSWVFPFDSTGSITTRPIIGKYNTANDQRSYQIFVNALAQTNPGNFEWWVSSDGDQRDNIFFPFVGNEWQHLVVTFKDGFIKMYINNELKASKQTSINSLFVNSESFIIGTNGNQNSFWNGRIAKTFVFDREVDDFDVEMLFNDNDVY